MLSSKAILGKATLRRELKNRLATMKSEERLHQSKIVVRKVLESTAYKTSKRVCLYLSMTEEVATGEILTHVLNSGRICFIPWYSKDEMKMLRLYSLKDYDDLPVTKWNIKQPADDDYQREEALESGGLDLILLPGLGFAKNGQRLGRGKGYYDKYLTKVFAAQERKPILMGLAFKEQILDSIPITENDIAVDCVICPDDSE